MRKTKTKPTPQTSEFRFTLAMQRVYKNEDIADRYDLERRIKRGETIRAVRVG